MKKMLLFLSFLYFFLFTSLSQNVYGIEALIPGINCGQFNNRCCGYIKAEVKLPTVGNVAIDGALKAVSGALSLAASILINPLGRIAETVVRPCIQGEPSELDASSPSCVCQDPAKSATLSLLPLCNNVSPAEKPKCEQCVRDEAGVWTGIGCVQSTVKDFLQKTVFTIGLGLAGVVAFICIIYSAFMIQISRGNPERIKKAQELLTSCIIGLLLVIFSVFIVRLIGGAILRIPGFS